MPIQGMGSIEKTFKKNVKNLLTNTKACAIIKTQ